MLQFIPLESPWSSPWPKDFWVPGAVQGGQVIDISPYPGPMKMGERKENLFTIMGRIWVGTIMVSSAKSHVLIFELYNKSAL